VSNAHEDLTAELNEALAKAPPMSEMEFDSDPDPQELLRDSVKRRAFLQRMGAAGLGFAAVGLLNGCNGNNDGNNGGPVLSGTATPGGTANGTATPGGTASGTATPSATARPGIDQSNFPGIVGRNINEVVLNYALALENFEADIYRQSLNVASGLAVTTPFSATRNYSLRVPAGALAPTGQAAQDAFRLLRNITIVEPAHRDFLRTTLRSLGAPIQPPNPGGYQFPGGALPGRDLRTILAQLLPIEENGPRAYLGAAPFLTTLGLIQTAGTIYSVECRQAASIADTLGRVPGPVRMAFDKGAAPVYPSEDTFEYFRSPSDVLTKIVPAFLRRDGSTNPSNGIGA